MKKSARRRMASIVNATQLGEHLGLTRQRITALADTEHVIERLPCGGFDQGKARLAYITWLRDPARRSAKAAAEAEFMAARTKLLEIKAAERLGQFMSRAGFEAAVDDVVGIFLTAINTMPARIGRGDLLLRRRVEAEVIEVRKAVSRACASKLEQKEREWDCEDAKATDGGD